MACKKAKAFTPLENLKRLFKRGRFFRKTKVSNSFTPLEISRRDTPFLTGRAGFTLIELIMVMVIIGILALVGTWIMLYFIQNAIFAPNQLNTDMAVSDAMNIMIEGDDQAKGLRFSLSVTAISGTNDITFINQDSHTIRYYLSSGVLYRTIDGGTATAVPYYASTGITMSAKAGTLFAYYDASESSTSTPANIRRVVIGLIAQTGSGNYSDWQGKSDQMSSVYVAKYQ
ncbi:MAG: type II secretion system protein [Candidatus Omnitrophica bacterium]|nr:type II secretion system protein [Candidatus Omnitrophota bacterium]